MAGEPLQAGQLQVGRLQAERRLGEPLEVGSLREAPLEEEVLPEGPQHIQ